MLIKFNPFFVVVNAERCYAGGCQLHQNQHREQAEALIVEQFIPKQEHITESSQGNRPADVPGQPLPEHQHKGNGRDDQQRQIQNQSAILIRSTNEFLH